MTKVYLLTDYKNSFGSKWKDEPYRSGYNKDYLKQLFQKFNIELTLLQIKDIDFTSSFLENQYVLYTSSEEPGLYYKRYIEDVIQALELKGAKVIPGLIYLKAHENKVFMELLRLSLVPPELRTIEAITFGTLEELMEMLRVKKIATPCVIKSATGSLSTGVSLARTEKELINQVKKVSNTFNLKRSLKERIRIKKHSGYLPDSQNQSKFIIQPFIPNLSCDWKVLIYGKKIFILQRNIKKNDFRASGSGYKYKAGSKSNFPSQYLDFVYSFYKTLNLPNLSLDFAYDGHNPYIIEFQALYFGTSTHYKSEDYFELVDDEWKLMKNTYDQESLYVESISLFLKNMNNTSL